MKKLMAGYGEKIINPPLGIELTGYGFYLERKANYINDDLKVRSLSIYNGKERCILISCDLIGLDINFSDKIRNEISKEFNLPFSNIMISSTHTHTGPTTMKLRGCGEIGEMEKEYLLKLNSFIKESVKNALNSEKESEFFAGFETIEPIGFNRRNGTFFPVDPLLKVGIFKRDKEKIYLINYACHPVILGKGNFISADWPGGVIRKIEKDGNYCIFFQGFCGDIDPVTNKNRWGKGTKEDIELYAEIIKNRVSKIEKYAFFVDSDIKCFYEKILLPLKIPKKEEIKLEKEKLLKKNDNPEWKKFLDDWEKEAIEKYDALRNNPYIEFPIHFISIGELKFIGLAGEIFCKYDLNLRKDFQNLFTFGYTDGVIGYIPTKDAYKIENDYACYLAPKIFSIFPFSSDIEDIILEKLKEKVVSYF